MDIKIFTAIKAFIIHNDRVLLLRESGKYIEGTNAEKYDVVGGRVQPGERFDASLRREIHDETGLEVTIGRPFFVNEWRPIVKGERWQIIGTFFECFADTDVIKLSEDHDKYIWIDPKKFKEHGIIENLIPAFESYLDLHK